jgi:hypothetical protein
LSVTTVQTIKVIGINREKGVTPGSDFIGHATLVRQA